MKCPYCGATENRVIDKRETENLIATRRRRECGACTKRFTTYERVEGISLYIIKKNGLREPFDKGKIEKGILRSCERRPISIEKIKEMVDEIETELLTEDTTEIQSRLIGNKIMRLLKKMDKVAYIRFASVYRDFEDVEEFHDAISKLIRKKAKKR
jgi:transcriptional repressor NrdR